MLSNYKFTVCWMLMQHLLGLFDFMIIYATKTYSFQKQTPEAGLKSLSAQNISWMWMHSYLQHEFFRISSSSPCWMISARLPCGIMATCRAMFFSFASLSRIWASFMGDLQTCLHRTKELKHYKTRSMQLLRHSNWVAWLTA